MSDEKSSRSAITTIITFVLLNIIWTGALNATADQHLISPSSDIVTEYRFEGPDVFDREIPFKVMYEINEVEGREPSEVTIDLVFSDDSIVNIHNGGSNKSGSHDFLLLPGPSAFLVSVKQNGDIYPVPSDLVEIDLRTEMEIYTPLTMEGYLVANLLAFALIVSDRAIRSWAASRRSKRGTPMIRKLRAEWKEVEKSISGGDPVDVDDLLDNSTKSSSMISKRRAWSVEDPEPEPEEGDQDIEEAEVELDELDELGEGDESGLQGKAILDDEIDTISDLWDKLGEGQTKRRGP